MLTPSRFVDAAALAVVAAFGALAALSHAAPVPLQAYGVCMAVAWLSFGAMLWRFGPNPGVLPVLRVLVWWLVFRAIGLAAMPVLEDDFYRYLWDGRSFVVHGTPYGVAPIDAFSDPTVPLAFQAVLDGINHPDLPTIYGPVAQWIFALGYLAAPAALWPLKLLLLAADGVAIAVLARLGGPRALLVYAWCPLAIHETAFNAHPEAIGVAFALAAFLMLGRDRVAVSGIVMALAVGTKAIACVLLPLLLWRAGPRRSARLLGAFAATILLIYLPFVRASGLADLPVLLQFSQAWEFNSTVYAVVAAAFGVDAARLAAGLVLAGALGIVVAVDRRQRMHGEGPPVPRADWLLGALFLVSPVVNPWYLLWLLPFVALHWSRWGLTALAAVSLSYAHGLFLTGLPAYHHPVWVRPLELALVVCAVCLDARATGRAQVETPSFDQYTGQRICGEAT